MFSHLTQSSQLTGYTLAAHDQAILISEANTAAGMPLLLAANLTNDEAGDIVIGRFDRDDKTFTVTVFGELSASPSPNAVMVTARRSGSAVEGSASGALPLPLPFGSLFGVPTTNVERSAIAMIGGATGAGLITLNPEGKCSLRFSGNTDLTLTSAPDYDGEAAIQVNSSDACGMCGSGSSLTIEAPETNIVGDSCWNGNPELNTELNPDSPAIPDPLIGLPEPVWAGLPDLGSIDDTSGIYPPGYYSGGLSINSSNTTVALEPGIYILDGAGLNVKGGNLIAKEVMFYIIGTGIVYLGGNGTITITPSSDEGDTYWGVSIFQARDNTNPATIIGTSDMNLEGTYYFPAAPLEIGGEGIALGNQMISWDLWIHGTGEFTIQYDGRFPAPGSSVFIVR